jgi:hypothetical protein
MVHCKILDIFKLNIPQIIANHLQGLQECVDVSMESPKAKA